MNQLDDIRTTVRNALEQQTREAIQDFFYIALCIHAFQDVGWVIKHTVTDYDAPPTTDRWIDIANIVVEIERDGCSENALYIYVQEDGFEKVTTPEVDLLDYLSEKVLVDSRRLSYQRKARQLNVKTERTVFGIICTGLTPHFYSFTVRTKRQAGCKIEVTKLYIAEDKASRFPIGDLSYAELLHLEGIKSEFVRKIVSDRLGDIKKRIVEEYGVS